MKTRISFFRLMLVLAFLFLWSRLFWLQIVKGAENKERANNNRIRVKRIPALRGVIYDFKGNILARNRPEGRDYLYKDVFAQVIGYLGEVSPAEKFKQQSVFHYLALADKKSPVLVGKMGLEKQYDSELRGEAGGILVEVNALGNIIREIKKQEPKAGKNLNLNLDLGLQQKAFQTLRGRKGAVVATDPRTGAVLALVSSPSFDPNIFSQRSSNKNLETIKKTLTNSGQPMFNRAIAGLYPPGSTFKIVTATAGLEEGKINASTLIEDTGEIKAGNSTFGNWYFRQYGKTEGMVDLIKALQRSNDIYFYNVGKKLGINKLAEWAKYFGLGQKSGIDLKEEVKGLVPSPEWKEKKRLEKWYLGDTFITAIGQGNLQLTPLQVNQMSSIIASMGKLCQPHLLKNEKSNCQKLNIKPVNLTLVKKGMERACSKGGTGWPFFNFSPRVGCKTGTAEYGDSKSKTHAWFTVFAPIDDPEINVTVLLESAGEGSNEAAPVAKKMLEYWFKKI